MEAGTTSTIALLPLESALAELAHGRRNDAYQRVREKAQAQFQAVDAQLQADLGAVIAAHVDASTQIVSVNFERAKSGEWTMTVNEADLPAPAEGEE